MSVPARPIDQPRRWGRAVHEPEGPHESRAESINRIEDAFRPCVPSEKQKYGRNRTSLVVVDGRVRAFQNHEITKSRKSRKSRNRHSNGILPHLGVVGDIHWATSRRIAALHPSSAVFRRPNQWGRPRRVRGTAGPTLLHRRRKASSPWSSTTACA